MDELPQNQSFFNRTTGGMRTKGLYRTSAAIPRSIPSGTAHLGISSTRIRRLVSEGRSVRYLVLPEVMRYIATKQRLYSVEELEPDDKKRKMSHMTRIKTRNRACRRKLRGSCRERKPTGCPGARHSLCAEEALNYKAVDPVDPGRFRSCLFCGLFRDLQRQVHPAGAGNRGQYRNEAESTGCKAAWE